MELKRNFPDSPNSVNCRVWNRSHSTQKYCLFKELRILNVGDKADPRIPNIAVVSDIGREVKVINK